MRGPICLLVASIGLSAACGAGQGTSSAPAVMTSTGLSTEDRQAYFGSCTFDADCVLTTFSGCCDACPGKVRVSSKKRLEQDQEPCKERTCPKVETEPCTPVDMSPYAAVCRLRACDMVPRGGR
jgi:hypothetical protein